MNLNFQQAKELCVHELNADNNNVKKINLTPMLWGGAGIGKTSMVKEIADEMGYELRVISLNTLSPLDVRGLPYIPLDNPEAFKFIPAGFVPTGKEPKPVLLFFDEINTAPPLSQVVAYQIALERNLGGHDLPVYNVKGKTYTYKGETREYKTNLKTAVILAGNRSKDKGATFEMPMPLANRLTHLYVEADEKEFTEYGLNNDINNGILAFIQSNPTYLHKMGNEYGFASPRSWHMLSVSLDGITDYSTPLVKRIIESKIGEGTGSIFFEFLRLEKYIPNIDDILLKGKPFSWKSIKVKKKTKDGNEIEETAETSKELRKDLGYYFATSLSNKMLYYSKKDMLTTDIVNNFEIAVESLDGELSSFVLSLLIKDTNCMRFLSKSKGLLERISKIFKN
jgi:hypothetical protein